MKQHGFSAPKNGTAVPPTSPSHLVGCTLAVLCLCALMIFSLAPRSTGADTQKTASLPPSGQGWIVMPEGARQAYFGIHGGTIPVSLLATSEGTSLVTFVGATGNDFLSLLRRAEIRMPSLLNGTQPGKPLARLPLIPGRGCKLTAGSSTTSLPVFYLSDEMPAWPPLPACSSLLGSRPSPCPLRDRYPCRIRSRTLPVTISSLVPSICSRAGNRDSESGERELPMACRR